MSANINRGPDKRGEPDPDVKTSKFTPPTGACDCHVHVFGPEARFPFLPERAGRSFDAPKEMLETMHRKIGMDRCVIVHGGAHGTDLSVTMDAMATSDREIRAVALVADTVTDARLEELHLAGFRGVRYSPSLGGAALDKDAVRRMAGRLAPLGWHILFHFVNDEILAYADLLDGLPVPFVLDHFGGIDPSREGANQEAFRQIVEHLTSGNGWVKTSAVERISRQDYPFSDATEIARALTETAPDRVLWGTDWPHPGLDPQRLTNDGDLVDLIPTYADDEATRQKLLVENPARLYGFD